MNVFGTINQVAEANGFEHSVWSIYGDDDHRDATLWGCGVNTADDFSRTVLQDGEHTFTYTYYTYEPGMSIREGQREHTITRTASGPLTVLDLWRIADGLIAESGDDHHIFIEFFEEDYDDDDNLVWNLITGS